MLVLILPSLRLYKSLCNSEFVHKLKTDFDLSITISENELSTVILDEENITTYAESKVLARIHKLALDIETYKRKAVNVSYETRIRLITNLPQPKELDMKTFFSVNSKYGVLLSILGSRIGYKIFGSLVRSLGSTHPGLTQVLDTTNPETIICFSGGFYSGVENFLGKYTSSRSIPFFLIIDNWDNLSSKSVLWNKPTLMGVWGPEMADDATELHNMDPSKVVQLGSSRLDLGSSNNLNPWFEKIQPYVLFAGTGIQHLDEIAALLEARHALDKLGYSKLSIIYRPHPWNLRGDFKDALSKLSDTPGLIVDQDIVENGSNAFYDQRSLFHLENLVKKCEFLIAGHSTVIVEALYYGKKVLALTGSTHSLFDTSDSWVIYRHMTRLRGNLGITECNQIPKISDALRDLVQSTVPSSNLVPNILPTFSTNYSTRVVTALKSMMYDANKSST